MKPYVLGKAYLDLTACFQRHGLPEPRLEARLLLEEATGLGHAHIVLQEHDYILTEQERDWLHHAAQRRLQGCPLAYILGKWDFWDMTLEVSEHVLIPRPETECLVEEALRHLPEGKDVCFADFGTGSGALVIALLRTRPHAQGLGVDISAEAVDVARENARRLGVGERADWLVANWATALKMDKRVFDLIVSNPPYIKTGERDSLMRDVRDYEPPLALYGGEDGLEAYRELIPAAQCLLRPGGVLILEIGADQEDDLKNLIAEHAAFTHCSLRRDYAGLPRIVLAHMGTAG